MMEVVFMLRATDKQKIVGKRQCVGVRVCRREARIREARIHQGLLKVGSLWLGRKREHKRRSQPLRWVLSRFIACIGWKERVAMSLVFRYPLW